MKRLNRLLLPVLASVALMGQASATQSEIKPVPTRCEYYITIESDKEIKPLPKDVMERCEAKLDSRERRQRTEYPFYGGSTLSGLRGSSRYSGITIVEDNHSTNLYREYSDKNKNGVPEFVYYNRDDCNDCVSEKEVSLMPQGERDSTILEFQHRVIYIADSVGGTKEDSIRVK